MSNPVHVWIDGAEYPSLLDAKMELGAMKAKAGRLFHAALLSGELYKGHIVSLAPPVRPAAPLIARTDRTLLRHPCTHRMGTYKGQPV